MKDFKETQWFNQWFMLLTLLIPLGLMIYCIYAWYIAGVRVDKVAVDDTTGQIVVLGLLGFTTLFLVSMRMYTKIDQDGIHYCFWPFVVKWRKVSWYDVESAVVKQYKPIADFGGWGIKMSMSKGFWAFSVKGKQGIFIRQRDGKELMLGTQKKDEATKILQYYLKKKTHEA